MSQTSIRVPAGEAANPSRIGRKWADPEAGRDYAQTRFASSRAEGRDPRALARILRRMAPSAGRASLLDLPCGSGRLGPALRAHAARYVGVDVSGSMLAAARDAAPGASFCRASAFRLPFADGSFEFVVCNRLLHHLDSAARTAVVRELVRVSSGLVIASFWDAASLPAWRRRAGLRRGKRDSRIPVSRAELACAFDQGGARIIGWHSAVRFLSMQTFVVAQCP